VLKSKKLQTPIGTLFAAGTDTALHYLGVHPVDVPLGDTKVLDQIEDELELYFAGKLKRFSTSLHFEGTEFQKMVWQALLQIPFGKALCYSEIAPLIQNPKASRAVGLANGKNPLIIVVPCHRVIQKDLSLGGYSAGLERKKWFLYTIYQK